jgi:uracil-DNA glycosylase
MKTCQWYECCPMKTYYEQGKLDKKWIDQYCKGDWENCVRYHIEEEGIPHPDNMLLNGKIDETLE